MLKITSYFDFMFHSGWFLIWISHTNIPKTFKTHSILPGMLSRPYKESKRAVKRILDSSSIAIQFLGLFVFPLTVRTASYKIWLLPIAGFLISFHWWENFVTYCSPWGKLKVLWRSFVLVGRNQRRRKREVSGVFSSGATKNLPKISLKGSPRIS